MKDQTNKHVIVAVGASAGGLEALNDFFDKMVKNPHYSFVIIQHLSPDHKSFMAELLSKKTDVPIVAVSDGEEIKRSHIYVIPPKMNLVIEDNHLRLLDKPSSKKLNLPIDLLMDSLASAFGSQVAGVVLSGTGSDGSRGIKAIKDAGGVVFVQQPSEAGFDGMPISAINTGVVDFIIPASEMLHEIYNYFDTNRDDSFGDKLSIADLESLRSILRILHKSTNINFNYYKRPTILRRTQRRMSTLKIPKLQDYHSFIKQNQDEIATLYKEFLIGVTKFFRDTDAWLHLEAESIPRIVRSKADGETLKVWDVACSTGQEAYSIAILFKEEMVRQNKDIVLKVFATDIADKHIQIAGRGMYDKNEISGISPEYLNRYFSQNGDNYVIDPEVRKCVIFSKHDILKDPPFKNMDMVVCRNLLIYFKPEIQTAVLQTLHYALKLEGLLFLGSSESNTSLRNYFETMSSKFKIFKNIQVSDRLHNELLTSNLDKNKISLSQKRLETEFHTSKPLVLDLQAEISSILVDQFDTASVYVDSELKVVDALGSFSKYAELPVKGFSLDLLKMLTGDLKTAVNSAIRKVKRTGKDFMYSGVQAQKDKIATTVDILVKPVPQKKNKDFHYVITFIEQQFNPDRSLEKNSFTTSGVADNRIEGLIEEIEEIRGELKKALEDAESSNEELQTLNEELLASNEELQSTNEELQSVNEELHTVNVEHVQKMDDLALLNADMDNILNSTQIATIFLDREMTIRKFTPSIQAHFKLVDRDIGKPISDFLKEFGAPSKRNLEKDIQKVMKKGKVIEANIQKNNGKHFIRRISPFFTNYRKIEGAVITFVDVTKIVESQKRLKISEKKFKEFYESDPVMHVSVDSSTGCIIECNRIFVDTLKVASKDEIIGRRILDFYTEDSRIKGLRLLDEIQNTGAIDSEQIVLLSNEGEEIPVILNSEIAYGENGNMYTRSTLVNISDLEEAQRLMSEKNAELQRINIDLEQFVSICSHDLQEPLGTIRFSSDVILKKFGESLDPKAEEYLGYIYGAAGRMSDQIKGLLEHSRIGQELERSSVNIQELLDIVKYDLGKRLKECNGVVHIGKMPTIQAYKTELRLLFQNLIGNSLKYSRKGVDPIVRVSAFQDKEYWTFVINDNGIGIAEEDIKNIFVIFGRAASQGKYEGTGVGLAHCEKIVKLHEGTIWADSQLGVGSTFYVKIKA